MNMAPIKYTWTRYHFKRKEIERSDFIQMKVVLGTKPDYKFDFIKPLPFLQQFWRPFVGTIIVTTIVIAIIMYFDTVKHWDELIYAPLIGIGIYLLFGGIQSMFSYLIYFAEHTQFYKQVRKDIIASKTYDDYLQLRKTIR